MKSEPRVEGAGKVKGQEPLRGGTLGTFTGVFTPSVLIIPGIILFLGLGYVSGSAGVRRALIILAVANIITILSSLSLAAVATNLKVKGGAIIILSPELLDIGLVEP